MVSLTALKRAYEILQLGVSPLEHFHRPRHPGFVGDKSFFAGIPRHGTVGYRNDLHTIDSGSVLTLQAIDDSQAPDPSEINIEAHFSVVDAFDMPPVHFDAVRGGFTTYVFRVLPRGRLMCSVASPHPPLRIMNGRLQMIKRGQN